MTVTTEVLFTQPMAGIKIDEKQVFPETELIEKLPLATPEDVIYYSGSGNGYCDYYAVRKVGKDKYQLIGLWLYETAEGEFMKNFEGHLDLVKSITKVTGVSKAKTYLFPFTVRVSQEILDEMINRNEENKEEFDYIEKEPDGTYKLDLAMFYVMYTSDLDLVNSDEHQYVVFQ